MTILKNIPKRAVPGVLNSGHIDTMYTSEQRDNSTVSLKSNSNYTITNLKYGSSDSIPRIQLSHLMSYTYI